MKRSTNTLRRLLALVLVLVMVGSLFAGCNRKDPDPTDPSETQGLEQTDAPTDAATEAPTEEPTEAPTEPVETVPPVLMGTVNADNLNVRSEPYSTSDILKRLAINTRIEILEQKIVDGVNWGRTADGWVNLNYVTIGVEFPDPSTNNDVVDNPNNVGSGTNATDANTSTTGTITTTLNIRKESNSDSTSVGTYKKGDKVTILERSGDWGRTNKGWINTKYVDFTNTVTADSSSSSSSGGGITTTVSNGSKVILGYGTVKRTTSLAIRSGPGANYSQVSYVRMNERHPYYQTSTNGWVRFSKGWVNADYLDLEYVVVEGAEATVTATTLSVREQPDYNSTRLATLAKGDEVIIRRTQGTWGEIEYTTGQYGWIDLDQVKLPTPVVSNYSVGVATITADALHIREKASYTSTALGTYTKGDKVTVTEINGNWGKTKDGWINLNYTKMESTYTTGTGLVTATNLNIRSTPSTSGKDLGTLKAGTKVTILDTEGNWGKIEYKSGKYGWISLKYVQMISISDSGVNTTGKYTVTINRPDNGSVTASTYSCSKGTTVTLTATPASGCALVGYYVVDANSNVIPVTNGKFTMPAANVTVTATFVEGAAPTPKSITVNSAISAYVTASHSTALAGTNVALSVKVVSGKTATSITVTDEYGNIVPLASDYTFTMPTTWVTITGVEVASSGTPHSVILPSSIEGGKITANLSSAVKNATVTLTAIPDTGYQLHTVTVTSGGNSVSTSGSGNKRTFTMPDADATVTAQFVKSQYTVSVSSVTGGSAAVDPSSCSYGTPVKVTYSADTNYSLSTIKVLGSNNKAYTCTDKGSYWEFSMPNESVTVVPVFSKDAHTITINSDSTSYVTPSHTTAVAGTTVKLTLSNPDDRFKLESVTVKAGDTSITVSGSGNERTFVMPESAVTVSAKYVAIGVYTTGTYTAMRAAAAADAAVVLETMPVQTIYAREGSTSEWIKTAVKDASNVTHIGWIHISGLTPAT